MLIIFIIAYIIISLIIGASSTVLVKNSQDFTSAGRSLPLPVVAATVFATWFGSETIIGIPAQFVDEGINGILEDPIGATICLFIITFFFVKKWYNGQYMTIGDLFRRRYSRTVELFCSIAIAISYLGWVAGQLRAFGFVISATSHEQISTTTGILIGSIVVIGYTVYGGMWSLAITDFLQMMVIIIGLLFIANNFFDHNGGIAHVIHHLHSSGKLSFKHQGSFRFALEVIAAIATASLGSISQEDIFQKIVSSKNLKTAQYGTFCAGILYTSIAILPVLIMYCGYNMEANSLPKGLDHELILPELIMSHSSLTIQTMFFGALASAIMSTASSGLLAPATILTKNIILPYVGPLPDKTLLRITRIVVVVFGVVSTLFTLVSRDSIYNMVNNSDKITMVIPFIPLVAGMYWKKANTSGAVMSISLGAIIWIGFSGSKISSNFIPPEIAGLIGSTTGMILGSYLPQAFIKAKTEDQI